MSVSNLVKVTEGIVELLNPLTPEERQRVIRAAFTLLGDISPALEAAEGDAADHDGASNTAVSARAGVWMKQNGITLQALEQVFHVRDGTATVIAAELPGTNNKEKVLNAYVLAGLVGLLATGEPRFTDKDARTLCTNAGCYDHSNHQKYLKAKGNSFTGTKDTGWTLTGPGLIAGAKIVQDLAKAHAE